MAGCDGARVSAAEVEAGTLGVGSSLAIIGRARRDELADLDIGRGGFAEDLAELFLVVGPDAEISGVRGWVDQ